MVPDDPRPRPQPGLPADARQQALLRPRAAAQPVLPARPPGRDGGRGLPQRGEDDRPHQRASHNSVQLSVKSQSFCTIFLGG